MKIAERNINDLKYADDTTLMVESEEELKNLDEGEREKRKKKKTGLTLNIKKAKIMASSPITSWKIDGEKVETVTDFILLGSKITMVGDSGHEKLKGTYSLEEKLWQNLTEY